MAQTHLTEASEPRERTCWAVSDGRAGIEAQALGLAEAVARLTRMRIVTKRIVVKAPWRSLPRALWGDPFSRLSGEGALLRPPYPDLWIACGRLSVPFTMAVKERNPATFTVQLQDPRAPLAAFDLVAPPLHDGLAGANVVATLGAAGRATRERLDADAALLAPALAHLPSPRVAALIGGPNRIYRYTDRTNARIARTLREIADGGAGLMVTASRRTDPETHAAVAEALEGRPHFLWDGRPFAGLDNPYFGLLGLADHVLVTADSVNMTTEAALTGRPVQILPLDRRPLAFGDGKFALFRRELKARRIARPFTDRLRRWSYSPLDETARLAEEVVRRLDAREIRAR